VDDGGAYELELGGTTTFTNCIFWGNTADIGASQISIRMDNPIPVLNVYYSDVETGTYGITPGFQGEYSENIDEDPIFQTYGEYHYVPDTLVGQTIDLGTQNSQYLPDGYSLPLYCLCGNNRVLGPNIDMGTYEAPFLVGIFESFSEEDFSVNIFPNPINANPIIVFYMDNEMPVQLSVMDIHGKIVFETELPKPKAGKNRLNWDAEKLAPGVYLCRLQTGNKVMTSKLVKLE
jgi:hypothetical protein